MPDRRPRSRRPASAPRARLLPTVLASPPAQQLCRRGNTQASYRVVTRSGSRSPVPWLVLHPAVVYAVDSTGALDTQTSDEVVSLPVAVVRETAFGVRGCHP